MKYLCSQVKGNHRRQPAGSECSTNFNRLFCMVTTVLKRTDGVRSELHTATYHPVEAVNLHCCGALSNCEFLSCSTQFWHEERDRHRCKGYAHVPASPGIGVDWDWDFIENCTLKDL
jgi:L-alanine-DL-glutamate epimerase-like enolase superfamily enzyme